MYKIFLVRYSIKNEKALKEVSKLAGPDTVVTILNAIGEQDAQASIKCTHINELTEKRSQLLEKHELL